MRLTTILLFISFFSFGQTDSISPRWNNCVSDTVFSENGKILEVKITQQEWLKTIDLRADMNITFGEFIIMPNHFHAIISIGKNKYNSNGKNAIHNNETDAMHCVSGAGTIDANRFGPQRKNLASIVRGFKSAVTTYARKNDITFNWQPNYHDSIVWDQRAFNTISNYIINNPKKWDADVHNK